MNSLLSQGESEVAERTDERRGSKSYQIFPETNVNEESDPSLYPEDFLFRRERLPSIVVEPTEHSELTSREHGWPAQFQQGNTMEEEEEEEDSSAEPSGSSADGEQQDNSR
ncbi:protein LBH-like [Cheilinus undulatus]|uniref:protein LBH-like n=1 Tax=Cheilinus undulatus TaxID=241271 RepID=UPI001BD5F250|nr:protein LBH-like [Cheilinus undulatus]